MDDVIKIVIYLQSSSKAMSDREKKIGRRKCENLSISRIRLFYMK